jgi:hypothetical protein
MGIGTTVKRAARSLGFEVQRVRSGGGGTGAAPPPAKPKLPPGAADPFGSLPAVPPTAWDTARLLPAANADGLAAIPMTDEQRYLFDLNGWLCLPALLSPGQTAAIREHVLRLHRDRASVPPHERYECAGPGQVLLDHPAVLGILNEVLSYQPVAAADCYGFRLENTFSKIRRAGDDNFDPHNGGGLFALCGNSHIYQHYPGRVHAGLTRVVWELNEVGPGDGGTLFVSGSHKAAFPRPASTNDPASPLWEAYACPAGSAVVFTEAVCHSGALWTNRDRDRVVVFNCYNAVGSKWHPGGPPPEVVAALPPMRRTLFRDVWVGDGYGQPANVQTG